MKFLLSATIFCALVLMNSAETNWSLFHDSSYPDKCVGEDLILSPGKTAQHPNACGIIRCYEENVVEITTCPLVEAPAGWKLKEPIAYSYPECCTPAIVPINQSD